MTKKIYALVLLSFLLVACSTTNNVDVNNASSVNVVSSGADNTMLDNSATVIIEDTAVLPINVNINKADSVTFINNANRTVNLFVAGFSTALREDAKETHVFDESGNYEFKVDNNYGGTVTVN